MPNSSLGYPFMAASRGSGAGGLLSTIIYTISSIAAMPWTLFLRWLSWCAALGLQGLAILGAPPTGYIPADKLRELNSIVDHMHAREDLYRRAIRELQDELDAKDSDRKRALKKLKSTKEEISQLTDRLSTLQQEYHSSAAVAAASRGQGGGAAPSGSMHGARLAVHGTFVIVVASVWWFCQKEHPALAWKLVFSMFFPLLWGYVSWVTAERSMQSPLLLPCASWFLIGVILAHSLGGHQVVVNGH